MAISSSMRNLWLVQMCFLLTWLVYRNTLDAGLKGHETYEAYRGSIALLYAVMQCALGIYMYRRSARPYPLQEKSKGEKAVDEDQDRYEDIESLDHFDWKATTPLQIRPFKPMYHLTMALENMPLSELIEIDNTYHDRLAMRESILEEHPEQTLACNPCAEPAVQELHHWLLTTYLPKRYPTIYQLRKPSNEEKQTNPYLHDATRNTNIPIPSHPTGLSALKTLGSNIDTDFLLLLPSSTTTTTNPTTQEPELQPLYHLEAFITTFPAGFDTRSKLGKPLAEIHKPVPGYTKRLEKSMDRFFAKLEVGKAVKRANWSVVEGEKLFTPAGTHLYADDGDGDEAEGLRRQREAVRPQEWRLRVERQTLHRLPRTRALVFAFKTYQYRLENVKADGDGEALALASEGLAGGSVPEMEFYKKGVVWGEKVREFLRS